MRLVTVRTDDGTRAGRIDGDDVVLLEARSVRAVLADEAGSAAAADRATGQTVALAEADLEYDALATMPVEEAVATLTAV